MAPAREPPGISGVIYGEEYATSDLGSWLPIPDTGSGGSHVFAVPMAGKEALFIRLVVIAE
ncbi:hypothetical protein OKA05_07745 [Luteolibacter arcticus]|uniref:Uncharacterized protein n=1 Tax=Luteolibacter arcticus TaxID=1581411 RepID=A0ABT3GGP6_9BACT|nr:hypothetical protein [Luteolibacter arcticus]MCW1922443.1 hypothetical protein [Luteolibacter arcticus]